MGKVVRFERKRSEAIQRAPDLSQQGSGRDFLKLIASHQVPRRPIANLSDKQSVAGVDVAFKILTKLNGRPGRL